MGLEVKQAGRGHLLQAPYAHGSAGAQQPIHTKRLKPA